MADANCFERDRYAADKEVAANTPSCATLAWGYMKYRHSVASTSYSFHGTKSFQQACIAGSAGWEDFDGGIY